jgi:hypothetical protein
MHHHDLEGNPAPINHNTCTRDCILGPFGLVITFLVGIEVGVQLAMWTLTVPVAEQTPVMIPTALMVEPAIAHAAMFHGDIMHDAYAAHLAADPRANATSFLASEENGELLFNMHWMNRLLSIKFVRMIRVRVSISAGYEGVIDALTLPTSSRCAYATIGSGLGAADVFALGDWHVGQMCGE